jgi:hypothetical protein
VAAGRLNIQQTNLFVLILNITLTSSMYALKSILLVTIAVTAAIAAPIAPIGKSATKCSAKCLLFIQNQQQALSRSALHPIAAVSEVVQMNLPATSF